MYTGIHKSYNLFNQTRIFYSSNDTNSKSNLFVLSIERSVDRNQKMCHNLVVEKVHYSIYVVEQMFQLITKTFILKLFQNTLNQQMNAYQQLKLINK